MEEKITLEKQAFKALASESRIAVLKALKQRRKTLSELANELGMAVSTMSEHLDQLEKAALVVQQDDGHKWKYYDLTRKGRSIVSPVEQRVMILVAIAGVAFIGLLFAGLQQNGTQSLGARDLSANQEMTQKAGAPAAAGPAIVSFFLDAEPPAAVAVEIADEPAEWGEGLMGRETLAEGAGMLFIFPDEQLRAFWMEDTLIPLDIIFISSNGTIVDIVQHARPCTADPCPTYWTRKPAQYVIEVNSGFSARHGVAAGQRVELP